MPANERLGSALRELAARGFVDRGMVKGWRLYKGSLALSAGDLPILFFIKDWNFFDYPEIQVVDGLQKFPRLRPHLNNDGGLCYFAPKSVVLDRYDPATAIAQCLEQAQSVLEKVLKDEAYRSGDLQIEFLVHWGKEDPQPIRVYMGSSTRGVQSASINFLAKGSGRVAIIADTSEDAAVLAKAMALGELLPSPNRCWIFRSTHLPPVPAQFPRTVAQLFEWLREWDMKMYHEIQHLLGQTTAYDFKMLPMAIHSPVGWIGFMFDVESAMKGATKPSECKKRLHDHGKIFDIHRLSFTDVSPGFVHSRNLSFRDLSGKRITLAGCGAIGSHLAAALVRLGAGSEGGLLRLLDNDILGPENLGRHYLGYDALAQPKASKLRSDLLRQFPLASIEAVNADVVDCPSLFAADLVVDATGEEAVSEYLNETWLRGDGKVPVLYVWIKGNGECVQCLWTDKEELACFRCLKEVNPAVHRQDRFQVLKRPPTSKVLGCHSFTPYAVSAPMHATALAVDIICDWLEKGDPSPRFRTRKSENADLFPVENHNPLRLAGCPACLTS